jgi:hypothetical protein
MLAALLVTIAAVTVLADAFRIREPSSIKHIHLLLHELGINLSAASLIRDVVAVLSTVGDAKAMSSPLILVTSFGSWLSSSRL